MDIHFMIQIDLENIDIMILEMILELLPNIIQLLTSGSRDR